MIGLAVERRRTERVPVEDEVVVMVVDGGWTLHTLTRLYSPLPGKATGTPRAPKSHIWPQPFIQQVASWSLAWSEQVGSDEQAPRAAGKRSHRHSSTRAEDGPRTARSRPAGVLAGRASEENSGRPADALHPAARSSARTDSRLTTPHTWPSIDVDVRPSSNSESDMSSTAMSALGSLKPGCTPSETGVRGLRHIRGTLAQPHGPTGPDAACGALRRRSVASKLSCAERGFWPHRAGHREAVGRQAVVAAARRS